MTKITCGDFLAICESHNKRVTHSQVRKACRKLNIRFHVDSVDSSRKGIWYFRSQADILSLLNFFHVNTWEDGEAFVLSKHNWENFEPCQN